MEESNTEIKDLIFNSLQEILPNDTENQNLILKLFPKDAHICLEGVLKETNKDLIARACAFPSFAIMSKFIDQYDEKINQVLEIDIKYILTLLSQSESLTSDGFLNRYKNDLKKYKLSKPKDLGSLTQNNKNQLDRIRNTVIRNIDFFMKFSPTQQHNNTNTL